MDRTVLFRGFVKNNNGDKTIKLDGKELKGYWVYWNEYGRLEHTLMHKDLAYFSSVSDFYIMPETVGQYTGFKDKNGKLIFEGDIGRVTTDNTNGKRLFEVCIGEFSTFYECDIYAGVYLKYGNRSISGAQLKLCDDIFEVIGNIYENGELLEES